MVCLREGVTYAIKVTILLTVAMDLFVNSYRLAQENQKEQNYCLTEACIETANSLFKVRKINTCGTIIGIHLFHIHFCMLLKILLI